MGDYINQGVPYMKYLYSFLLFPLLILSACGSVEASPSTVSDRASTGMPVPGESPTEMVVATSSPEPTRAETPGLPFTTYTDPASGYSFDYPTSWMLDAIVLGDRAPSGIQLTSWAHEPGMISEVFEGGTIMNINIQLWDPKSDLEAFAATRLQAWDASGFLVISSEDLTLANGQLAKEFVIQSPDGPGYFLLTMLGENYLVASGNGDLEMVRRVARSIR
jgi:hypothetical protein